MIGKTGSGKTTTAALVALVGASQGRRVLAVDTDTSPNLAISLGLDLDAADAAAVVPRALARGRAGGSVTAAEMVATFGIETPAGVTLLHAMQANDEPAGCACPAHASQRSVLADALDGVDLAVVDMEAGLDHLDRPQGTLAHAGVVLVVVEPSRKSQVTAARMVDVARSWGVTRLALVGTKAQADRGDDAFLAEVASDLGLPLAGVVPYDEGIVEADRAGAGLAAPAGDLRAAVERIVDAVAGPA